MCYDRSWFTSQEKAKADERKEKDKRSETVETLLRESKEQAQKAATERAPAKEHVSAK